MKGGNTYEGKLEMGESGKIKGVRGDRKEVEKNELAIAYTACNML